MRRVPRRSQSVGDRDGDGWGDNAGGTYPDAFPDDPTQWRDADGDGYGDNATGNPDAFPSDPTQWADQDGDDSRTTERIQSTRSPTIRPRPPMRTVTDWA